MTTTRKPIEYEIDCTTCSICPKCKEELDYLCSTVECDCGWSGKVVDAMTKRVSILVKAIRKTEYLK